MDCDEYDLSEAIVFNNENLRVAGKIVYPPSIWRCSSKRTIRPRLFTRWICQIFPQKIKIKKNSTLATLLKYLAVFSLKNLKTDDYFVLIFTLFIIFISSLSYLDKRIIANWNGLLTMNLSRWYKTTYHIDYQIIHFVIHLIFILHFSLFFTCCNGNNISDNLQLLFVNCQFNFVGNPTK